MSQTDNKKMQAEIAKANKEDSKDMKMTFLGTGDRGQRTLWMVLKQTKVLKLHLKPEEVEARNAGMRILYDMLGENAGVKIMIALIKGLGGTYEDFKEETHRDSQNQDSGGQ